MAATNTLLPNPRNDCLLVLQGKGHVERHVLTQPERVTVTPAEAAAWELHQTKLEAWGWRCRPSDATNLLMLAVPRIEGTVYT